ncbi:MAG TPA: hypothetical protein VJ765_07310, partial [Chitinophagaceae bacterium]|nr:hypothetical protein [Chitinophagaceae bacterium]
FSKQSVAALRESRWNSKARLISQHLPAGRLNKGINLLRIMRKDQKDVVLKVLFSRIKFSTH